MMVKKLRLWILLVLIAVLLSATGLAIFTYPEIGMARIIGVQAPQLSEADYASIPQSVITAATKLAGETVGNSQDKLQDLVNQLLSSYLEARDQDVIVVFNPGGWGWKQIDHDAGWRTILEGIESKLDNLGYNSLALSYQRTSKGLVECLRELFTVLTRYPAKARELAVRVEFLTDNIPNLRVIVAGESTGTVISDKTMSMLENETQVYSIQTGTPFWHKPLASDRTLMMNSNGKTIDTFSYGKISTMVWATVKGWFGFSTPGESPGTILLWLRAPGHDYSWQYPGVSSEIVKFLDDNFVSKKL